MRSSILTSKRARSLRREMTEPEVMLWSYLRRRLPDQPIFRRQYAMGPFILDFYCPSARLAVEIDGATHWQDDQAAYDRRRDLWLARQGVRVVRIGAAEVFARASGVADSVRLTAAAMLAASKVRG